MTDLTAVRSGDEVRLQWTTPGRTTDGVAIQGTVTAEICLTTVAATGGRRAPVCALSETIDVRPGTSQAVERLPGDLGSGGPRLVMFRVQLRGRTGKTAGPGAAAYVAAGEAPDPVRNLKATDTKAGALLEWTPAPVGLVELERRAEAPPDAAKATGAGSEKAAVTGKGLDALLQRGRGRSTGTSDSGLVRLSGGPVDAGGVIDRTAEVGRTYRYSAQRVRTVEIAGKRLEVRSVPSPVVTLAMREVFPPEVPLGLVAAPGPGSIDLSWEPGVEPGRVGEGSVVTVAGFRVYRKDESAGEWVSLTPALVATPAYRDTTAQAGRRYRYRVTAVDAAGHESAPSGAVVEGLEP
ncbi:MAG: hypothetical protein NVSMB62_20200 [Acidobacteriaceae bacterium]